MNASKYYTILIPNNTPDLFSPSVQWDLTVSYLLGTGIYKVARSWFEKEEGRFLSDDPTTVLILFDCDADGLITIFLLNHQFHVML